MKKLLIILLFWLIFTSCESVWWKKIVNNIEINNQKEITQHLSVNDFKQKISEDFILIDIRTKQEIDRWIIWWADLFLDYYSKNFITDLNKLDKNKKYLIYCAHWNRSWDTLIWMKKMWFSDVFDLKWWIVAWIDSWENIVKKLD